MVFSSNPLSLSVPDSEFESWLRDSGHLEVLDDRTTAAAAAATTAGGETNSPPSLTNGFVASLFSYLVTFCSLFTINPFAKLTTDDFSGETASWTLGFFGSSNSYSFPSSASQARMRVHENVKRFARNYATLSLLFFACTLYQMPLSLVGLIGSLVLWDLFKLWSDKWGLDQYPVLRQVLIRTAQCVTAIILICVNFQLALFATLGVSYTVMVLHAAFRKLTPAKKPSRKR
ncbi:PRA1 family protein H [Carica papaya]|uniref:PRA1 family protein H n=1 Tax=Carica papaya TaxID=3649 RepID=UPI000B8D1AF9|nr:PRA1 family protein H [Carica papaya]